MAVPPLATLAPPVICLANQAGVVTSRFHETLQAPEFDACERPGDALAEKAKSKN